MYVDGDRRDGYRGARSGESRDGEGECQDHAEGGHGGAVDRLATGDGATANGRPENDPEGG